MNSRSSFYGSGMGGNIQTPAVLVDKLIGTAYEIVKLVADHIPEIKHISVNFPHLITANDNIDVIRAVSMKIVEVNAVAGKLQEITEVSEIIPQINALYGILSELVEMGSILPQLKAIGDNMDGLLDIVANIDTIEQIIPLVPLLQEVMDQKDEILDASREATTAAATSTSNAALTAADRVAVSQAEVRIVQLEDRTRVNANSAAGSAQAAEATKNSLLTGLQADAVTIPNTEPAAAVYDPVTRKVTFRIPRGERGVQGIQGIQGETGTGWSPLFALKSDGERRVYQIIDWINGTGVKPPVTNLFVGPNGIVNTLAAGANVRGPGGPGTGDMLGGVYDPNNVNDDAFNHDHMLDGSTYVRFALADRIKLNGIEAGANKTPNLAAVATSGSFNDLTDIPDFVQGTVRSVGISVPDGFVATGGPITDTGIIELDYAPEYQGYTSLEALKLMGIASGATANDTDAALRARSSHTGTQAQDTIVDLVTDLAATEKSANKGQANGYASLNASGKVPLTQMDESILGAMNYQGVWDAATNTPAIPAATPENKGHFRIINVAGTTTVNGESNWNVGDWIVSSGVGWNKIDSTDQVNSVNGKQGTVVLNKADVGLGNVANKSEAEMVASGAIKNALDGKASSAQGAKADSAVQPADIKNGATITYYQGTSAPNNAVGQNGDIYLRTT